MKHVETEKSFMNLWYLNLHFKKLPSTNIRQSLCYPKKKYEGRDSKLIIKLSQDILAIKNCGL